MINIYETFQTENYNNFNDYRISGELRNVIILFINNSLVNFFLLTEDNFGSLPSQKYHHLNQKQLL